MSKKRNKKITKFIAITVLVAVFLSILAQGFAMFFNF